MNSYHLLHTDLVFYAIRRSINYAKNIYGGFAKSHCESLWFEGSYIVVFMIHLLFKSYIYIQSTKFL